MTEQKAIETLEYIRYCNDYKGCREAIALDVAIKALEKQIPKKPLYKQGTRYKWIDSIRERGRYRDVEKWSNMDACPNCKNDILRGAYCEKCGQKLDWGEQNEQT